MKNKGFVGKCKTASGEEAQNLKHEIRNEEVFTAKAGEELLGIGDWLLGEENEEADSFKGSDGVTGIAPRDPIRSYVNHSERVGAAGPRRPTGLRVNTEEKRRRSDLLKAAQNLEQDAPRTAWIRMIQLR